MKTRSPGFSMIEILMALVFVSFSFLPIYNLFRFGQQGTISNEKETEATNYASDLINFMRDRKGSELDQIFKGSKNPPEFKDDSEIAAILKQGNITPPPQVGQGFVRAMQVKRFDGKNTSGPIGIVGWLSDFINRRRAVANYLVMVKVSFKIGGQGKDARNDDVTLYTIVLD